ADLVRLRRLPVLLGRRVHLDRQPGGANRAARRRPARRPNRAQRRLRAQARHQHRDLRHLGRQHPASGAAMNRPTLSRRRFWAIAAVGLTLPLIAAAPETLPRREAKFTYSAKLLKIRVGVPDLLREADKQAMKLLDG